MSIIKHKDKVQLVRCKTFARISTRKPASDLQQQLDGTGVHAILPSEHHWDGIQQKPTKTAAGNCGVPGLRWPSPCSRSRTD
eukprot:1088102-Prorocentrum_minimum.AAC.2